MGLPNFAEILCPDDNERLALKWRNFGHGKKIPYYACVKCGRTKSVTELGLRKEVEVKAGKSTKFRNFTMINGRMVELDRFGHPVEEKE